jgi:hypothetical protein
MATRRSSTSCMCYDVAGLLAETRDLAAPRARPPVPRPALHIRRSTQVDPRRGLVRRADVRLRRRRQHLLEFAGSALEYGGRATARSHTGSRPATRLRRRRSARARHRRRPRHRREVVVRPARPALVVHGRRRASRPNTSTTMQARRRSAASTTPPASSRTRPCTSPLPPRSATDSSSAGSSGPASASPSLAPTSRAATTRSPPCPIALGLLLLTAAPLPVVRARGRLRRPRLRHAPAPRADLRRARPRRPELRRRRHRRPAPRRPRPATTSPIASAAPPSSSTTTARSSPATSTTPTAPPRSPGAPDNEPGPTYRFTGKEDHALASAVSIGARQYLPALGRWASPDPQFLLDPEAQLARPGERNLYATPATARSSTSTPRATAGSRRGQARQGRRQGGLQGLRQGRRVQRHRRRRRDRRQLAGGHRQPRPLRPLPGERGPADQRGRRQGRVPLGQGRRPCPRRRRRRSSGPTLGMGDRS